MPTCITLNSSQVCFASNESKTFTFFLTGSAFNVRWLGKLLLHNILYDCNMKQLCCRCNTSHIWLEQHLSTRFLHFLHFKSNSAHWCHNNWAFGSCLIESPIPDMDKYPNSITAGSEGLWCTCHFPQRHGHPSLEDLVPCTVPPRALYLQYNALLLPKVHHMLLCTKSVLWCTILNTLLVWHELCYLFCVTCWQKSFVIFVVVVAESALQGQTDQGVECRTHHHNQRTDQPVPTQVCM